MSKSNNECRFTVRFPKHEAKAARQFCKEHKIKITSLFRGAVKEKVESQQTKN